MTELGDETFIIAAIMAMRHSRLTVYAGAMSALALMTVSPVPLDMLTMLHLSLTMAPGGIKTAGMHFRTGYSLCELT